MSESNVISLARARIRRANGGGSPVPPHRPHKGAAIVVQVRSGDVDLIINNDGCTLTPAQARELAQDLLELADDAESRRG